jgi:hypothetical protein
VAVYGCLESLSHSETHAKPSLFRNLSVRDAVAESMGISKEMLDKVMKNPEAMAIIMVRKSKLLMVHSHAHTCIEIGSLAVQEEQYMKFLPIFFCQSHAVISQRLMPFVGLHQVPILQHFSICAQRHT